MAIEVYLDYKEFKDSMDVYIVKILPDGRREICTSIDNRE